MTKEEILADRRLIAEFLGCQISLDKKKPLMYIDIGDGERTMFYCEWHTAYTEGTNILAWDFAPDKNWCQLMPAYNKFRLLKGMYTKEQQKKHGNYIGMIITAIGNYELQDAAHLLSSGIQWYNTQNKQ